MKSALSASLVGAAVFAAGALAYRLGQSRCAPVRAAAGTAPSLPAEPMTERRDPSLPKPTEAVNSLLERLRAQGL